MDKIAIQFSGGKDSTVMLYRLRHLWDRATVYWVCTSDTPPEVLEFVEKVSAIVPNFVAVYSDAITDRQINGYPVDILTNDMAIAAAGGITAATKYRSSYACCFANVMEPMHRRMVEDGITTIYRGQRTTDVPRSPIKDGDVFYGITYRFPLGDCTTEQIFAELQMYENEGLPVPTIYEHLDSSPDCLGCTGWVSDRRGTCLRDHHPSVYEKYIATLTDVRQHLQDVLAHYVEETSNATDL
jgi:phosphoadenosine phosphosulfate reductase